MTDNAAQSRRAFQRVPALAFGAAMIALSVPQLHRATLWIAGLSVVAVLLTIRFRSAASAAVCLSALQLAVSAPPAMLTAASGLCAAGFLVATYAGSPMSAAPTRTTAAAALGFALIGVGVILLPLDVAWSPLIAPVALLGAFAIVAIPYAHKPNR